MSGTSSILCHECDKLHQVVPIQVGGKARCVRCGGVLYTHRPDSVNRTIAWTLAGVVLFIVANVFPFLSFHMQGQVTETNLITGVFDLWAQGKWELAVVVLLTAIAVPGLQLFLLIYVLVPLKLGRAPSDLAQAFRVLRSLAPWAMMEVFMLGILVSVVKLSAMASIVPGLALWAFALLIIVLAAASASLDPHEVWQRVPWDAKAHGKRTEMAQAAGGAQRVGCHSCALTCMVTPDAGGHIHAACPRCGDDLHHRKPNSLARTWALLIAAYILYIPANVLPVMAVTSLGATQSDTIMSGVIYLWQHGDWPLALLIFFASVAVPMLKMLILTYILISVQVHSQKRPRDRTQMYRITEAVGRWSMVDIYVVTIMVALVRLGNLATIEAGMGAVFFCGVVVVTMFAAMSFDPRLIWDRLQPQNVESEQSAEPISPRSREEPQGSAVAPLS